MMMMMMMMMMIHLLIRVFVVVVIIIIIIIIIMARYLGTETRLLSGWNNNSQIRATTNNTDARNGGAGVPDVQKFTALSL